MDTKLPATTGQLRTIALDPGTREMGYAVLEDKELVFFGVRTFRTRSGRKLVAEARHFLSELVTDFAPHVVAIEKTRYSASRRSGLLHPVVDELTTFARRNGIRAFAVPPRTVMTAIVGEGRVTRRDVTEMIVRWYPYLERYLRKDQRSREVYWSKMFNAIALALTAYETAAKERFFRATRWRKSA